MRPLPGVEGIRRRLGYAAPPTSGPTAAAVGQRAAAGPPVVRQPAPPNPPGLAGLVARHPVSVVTVLLSFVVAAFSQLWTRGALVMEGPGHALYLRLATGYADAIGRVPYWLPEMWAGGPSWALAPSFPVLLLVPLASVTGADVAIKVGILVLQVVGGIGTYVLARSLWDRSPACVVAALVYTLHPLVVAHGALGGSRTAAGVVAALPWLIWSMRRGLRGDGAGFLVMAGLTAAFATLHQPELASALALLCVLLVLGEMRRSSSGSGGSAGSAPRPGQLLKRAAVVVGVAVGVLAHWLVPFLALRRWFVLSPPDLVRGDLSFPGAAHASREIGTLLDRSDGLHGAVSFQTPGLLPELLYLSWVCVLLSLVTLVLVARGDREDEPALATVLVVALFGVWAIGSGPLASSGPARPAQWLALATAGAAAGLVVGGYLRRMHLGKTRLYVVAAGVAMLVAFPFVTPFGGLRAVEPLLATLRIPRFYVLVPLGLALGTAYPITHLARWAAVHRPSSRLLGSSALAVAVVAAFAIDVFPYNSFYRVHPPPSNGAYERLTAELATAAPGETRVNASVLDPRTITELLKTGHQTSVGWPQSSGVHLWRLTGETYVGPNGYREAAYGLSGTGYLALEQTTATGTPDEAVADVVLVRNPRTLPLVRSYEQVVVVEDANLSPLLATGLAARNVGVVNGTDATPTGFAGMPSAVVGSSSPCRSHSVPELGPLAGEVAIACGLDPWLGAFFAGASLEPLLGQEVGGVHQSLANGLRGIAVWLDGWADRARLALHEVGADGRTLGPELSRGQAVGFDEYGLTTFTFDPIPDSAGRRFAFVLRCDGCVAELRTNLVTGPTRSGTPANLIIDGRLLAGRQAAFVPIYDRLPPASPPRTTTIANRPEPGRWRVETDGGQPSLLVVAETYFPGWEATVDGRDVPVFEADGAFVGVYLPPGPHMVTLEFRRPAAAVVGRAITFATLLGVAVFGWLRRKRPRDRDFEPGGWRSEPAEDGPAPTDDPAADPAADPDGEGDVEPAEGGPAPDITEGEVPGDEGGGSDDGGDGPGDEGDEAVAPGEDEGDRAVAPADDEVVVVVEKIEKRRRPIR